LQSTKLKPLRQKLMQRTKFISKKLKQQNQCYQCNSKRSLNNRYTKVSLKAWKERLIACRRQPIQNIDIT
jgi:hypothetical protein